MQQEWFGELTILDELRFQRSAKEPGASYMYMLFESVSQTSGDALPQTPRQMIDKGVTVL